MPQPTHPCRRDHGLFTYAAVSQKNEWGTCGWRGDVREVWPTSVNQTQGCVEESQEDVILVRDVKKAKTVSNPSRFQLCVCSKCASMSPDQAWGKCCPLAALGSCCQSLHLQSNSIKSRPAANKPWQILSFENHFGTAVVPCKRGDREGEASSQYNVCRVSARPGWQRHECLSQETSVLLSHSAVGQSIWLLCCTNSINSYLPFRSYYAE